MANEDDVDIFLRFCEDEAGKKKYPGLCGESLDALCVGDPFNRRKSTQDDGGWFRVKSFHFSVTGTEAGKAGGAGGAPAKKGGKPAAPAGGHGATEEGGRFGGVEVTIQTQFGSPKLMKICTEFAQPPGTAGRRVEKIKKAYFYVRTTGQTGSPYAALGSGQDWYVGVFLFGVTLQAYAFNSSGEDTFTLNYEKIAVQYWPTDFDNPDPSKRILSDTVNSYEEWLNAPPEEDGGD